MITTIVMISVVGNLCAYNMECDSQTAAWLPALMQVSDPLFPSGAYAHSMGLEQWAHVCQYRDGDDLSLFFKEHAWPALARLELPYLRYVRDAIATDDWQLLLELDAEIDAWKWSVEIREGSIAQGRGRLRMLRKLWPDDTRLERYAKAYAVGDAAGHNLVVTALQYQMFAVPVEASLSAYAYQSLANFVSASIKLLRISPESAQVALRSGLEFLPCWVAASKEVEHDAAGWFAPAFDISSARHATAFSRLFIS